MTYTTSDEMMHLAQSHDTPFDAMAASENGEAFVEEEAASANEVAACIACEKMAIHTCHRCKDNLCEAHSYCEEGGTLYYCRACADEIVGVCDVCDALHARPCRECGQKVCEIHQKRVIERWGWGGEPGQGGVTSWFPVLHTYCQEHSQNRVNAPKPTQRTFIGYDGSSPEW